jgi:formate dehydrogenase beta subunit
MNPIFEAVLVAGSVMGALGLFVGVGLAVASKVFYVYVDPTIEAVDDVLPGANCGGCGLPGCGANAEAIVAGKAAPNSCVAAGPETAEAIAAILGVSVEAKEPDFALPGCTYGIKDAETKFIYDGLPDCRAAAFLSGGMKVCQIGCLGLGSCVAACRFDALSMGPDQLPKVDQSRCTGCGACEKVCPKDIISLSSVTRRIMKEYTTADCTTPCQRSCPAGINISEYIRQISLGDYHRAVQVIKERNPFPTVIGRICPRPCENDCRRQLVDEPVAINFLKRFVADYEREQESRVLPFKAPDTGRRVAVVGGGVQGLSAAFFLARLGHAPTVYEASEALGGLLRSAIATYRLPREVLDWDIQGVVEMGVETQTGKRLGSDFTVDSLLSGGAEAVFLATGGWDSRLATKAGPDPAPAVPGLLLLMDVLRAGRSDSSPVKCHGDTVILGGGDLAWESALQCLKLGAVKVHLLTTEPLGAEPGGDTDQDLPQDTVLVHPGLRLVRLLGEDGKLTGIEVEASATGERRHMDAGSVVFAAGRLPELVFTRVEETEGESAGLRWEAFAAVKNPLTDAQPGIMAAGDATNDFSAAIKAIGAGRRAAASVHQVMYGLPVELPIHAVRPQTWVQNVQILDSVAPVNRIRMPLASAGELAAGEELEKGFDEAAAKAEAARCLQCGLICYEQQTPRQQSQDTQAA